MRRTRKYIVIYSSNWIKFEVGIHIYIEENNLNQVNMYFQYCVWTIENRVDLLFIYYLFTLCVKSIDYSRDELDSIFLFY